MKVTSARVSTLVHATEDPRKVIHAVSQVCGPESSEGRLEKQTVKGHFGNPITTLTVNLEDRGAESSLSNIWRRLSSLDSHRLIEELIYRLDEESKLHLRFDKQECFKGELRLRDEDPIRAQFAFQPPSGWADVRRFLESQSNNP